MTRQTDPEDPKGLIREAFRIDGITYAECRTIFLDWALSLPAEREPLHAIRALLSRHQGEPHDHPMQLVLREGLDSAPPGKRRGGRNARVG